jgi:hypothetical protein
MMVRVGEHVDRHGPYPKKEKKRNRTLSSEQESSFGPIYPLTPTIQTPPNLEGIHRAFPFQECVFFGGESFFLPPKSSLFKLCLA